MPETIWGGIGLILTLVLLLAGLIFGYRQRQTGMMILSQIVGIVLFAAVAMGAVLPTITPEFSSKAIGERLEAVYETGKPLYIVKFLRPGIAFYTDLYGKELPHKGEDMTNFLRGLETESYLVCHDREIARLPQELQKKMQLLENINHKQIYLFRP